MKDRKLSPLERLAQAAEDEPSWCPGHQWSPWIPLTRRDLDRVREPDVFYIYVGNVSKRFCLICSHTDYAGATASNYDVVSLSTDTAGTGELPSARRRQFFHPTKRRHKGWYRRTRSRRSSR